MSTRRNFYSQQGSLNPQLWQVASRPPGIAPMVSPHWGQDWTGIFSGKVFSGIFYIISLMPVIFNQP
ncbi:MAG: hypothetical protein ACM3IJ_04785 [Candidatus Levyibacteriota bacterium]